MGNSRSLRIGKIVRKMTETGVPIGPYLQVVHANGYIVRLIPLGANASNIKLIRRENIYIPKTVHLCVSNEKIKEIINGETVVSHKYCTTWAATKEADLVEFYATAAIHRVHCVIAGVKFYSSFREKMVRVIIDRVLLCE